tara:strand:- start:816 stop:1523 length:708 start_codon:yes stop_codon:yes gene_type:complete
MTRIFQAYNVYILILISSYGIAEIKDSRTEKLLKTLYNNEGWVVDNIKDGISLSRKKIENMELTALMVKQEIMIPKEIVQSVVMDVNNYEKFLNNQGLISKVINRGINWVDGYQYIPIDIPLIANREYLFRMYPDGHNNEDTISIIHWYLLDKKQDVLVELNERPKDTVYLDHGAGLWVAEEIENNIIILSYRIYMDPGGSLPDFMIDIMNKVSVVNVFKDAVAEAQNRHNLIIQ